MKVHTDKLTSRQRFTLALSHQETDRVPADLGGLSTTIRTIDLYQRLRSCLGLPSLKKVRHFVDEHIVPDEDLAMQQGPLMSLELFRRYVKPQHKKVVKAIRNHTDAAICLHICGSAYAFIPDFIDLGIGVLNPVQIRATDMEPDKLKAEFGDVLSFHGAVDSQEVLPSGSPKAVQEEVRSLVQALGNNGGYVLAPCHSIQPDVPPENIRALFAAERRLHSL